MIPVAEEFCLPHIVETFININTFRTAYIVCCVLILPILFASVVGNVFMLYCLWKCQSLHPPFKALLRGLVLADLGVGLIAQPLFLASNYTALTQNFHHFCAVNKAYNTAAYFLAATSFLTATSIAVDRYLAIRLRIRYRQFATLKRIVVLLASIWIVCAVLSCVWMWDLRLHRSLRNTLLFSCITIACVSYIRVFILLRHHQVGFSVNQTRQNAASLHLARYKNTVTTTAYVFIFLLLCFLPYLFLSVAARRLERNATLGLCVDFASVLVLANSLFNPALYCWRIPEIRHLAKETFGKFFCKISSS